MKIRAKRSAYFYIVGSSGSSVKTRFAYADEIPGGVENMFSHPFPITEGEEVNGLIVQKIDAERPFVLFSGTPYGSSPNATAHSSIGSTYSKSETTYTGDAGSSAAIFPGLKCGDFVKIGLS